jgi:hypothetical protein
MASKRRRSKYDKERKLNKPEQIVPALPTTETVVYESNESLNKRPRRHLRHVDRRMEVERFAQDWRFAAGFAVGSANQPFDENKKGDWDSNTCSSHYEVKEDGSAKQPFKYINDNEECPQYGALTAHLENHEELVEEARVRGRVLQITRCFNEGEVIDYDHLRSLLPASLEDYCGPP